VFLNQLRYELSVQVVVEATLFSMPRAAEEEWRAWVETWARAKMADGLLNRRLSADEVQELLAKARAFRGSASTSPRVILLDGGNGTISVANTEQDEFPVVGRPNRRVKGWFTWGQVLRIENEVSRDRKAITMGALLRKVYRVDAVQSDVPTRWDLSLYGQRQVGASRGGVTKVVAHRTKASDVVVL